MSVRCSDLVNDLVLGHAVAHRACSESRESIAFGDPDLTVVGPCERAQLSHELLEGGSVHA